MSTTTSIRDSVFYKGLDSFTATGLAEGFIETESRDEVVAAWQFLHDTGLAYQLQGWFGRTAQALLSEGFIED